MKNLRHQLSFINLFGYLEALPTSRCISEGEELVNAQHIISCVIVEKNSSKIQLFALCLQASALNDKPHEIKVFLNIVKNAIVVGDALCSCKAGMSKRCKHVAAVLILCTRESVSNFPLISSTDVKCYWNKSETATKHKPIPIQDHSCFAEHIPTKVVSQITTDSEAILTFFKNALPGSALAKHSVGRRSNIELVFVESRSTKEQTYIKSLLKIAGVGENFNLQPVFLNDCCSATYYGMLIADVTAVERQSKSDKFKWPKERQFRITGSRCYALYTYAVGDWETKAKQYFWPKQFKSKYTEHGLEHESAAREAYKTQSHCEVLETGLIVSEQHNWLACTPDGIVFKDEVPIKLLEIKCPCIGKTCSALNLVNSCTFLKVTDGNIRLEKKHAYYGQIQLNLPIVCMHYQLVMFILNLRQCDFIVYASFDKSSLNISVNYDKDFCTYLITKLHYNFFNKMLRVICINKSAN